MVESVLFYHESSLVHRQHRTDNCVRTDFVHYVPVSSGNAEKVQYCRQEVRKIIINS